MVIRIEKRLSAANIGRLNACVPPNPNTALPRYITGSGKIFLIRSFEYDGIVTILSLLPVKSTIMLAINCPNVSTRNDGNLCVVNTRLLMTVIRNDERPIYKNKYSKEIIDEFLFNCIRKDFFCSYHRILQ